MNHKCQILVRTLVRFVFAVAVVGCAADSEEPPPYFTSGSNEADQRAEQRVTRVQQARGDSEGEDENSPTKASLYERLGGQKGIAAIVDDAVARMLADPRVNWTRKGVNTGGFVGIGGEPAEWQANEQSIARLKKHFAQFLAVATGGPTEYQGRQMAEVHREMKITNAEFDAAVGDIKATLDKLGLPTAEQRELLAIIESTRPQVVEER